jgi:hypothetical protein
MKDEFDTLFKGKERCIKDLEKAWKVPDRQEARFN